MTYRFLEDVAIADVAFEVQAETLPDLFKDAAQAILAIQLNNPDALINKVQTRIHIAHKEVDMLLYLFLQELVYLKDVHRWLLKAAEVKVKEDSGITRLEAEMAGEELDSSRHEQRADIKAVTLHNLKVEPAPHGWSAVVVVDI